MSGVGKGIAASSISRILKAKGFAVNPIKIDPYLNVDAGTMNPTEHGEVFVLRSGLETDQDMGNYERFLGVDLNTEDYMTSGMIYREVIEKERALEYKGKCVEAIPHVRDAIIDRIEKAAASHKSDITVIEIGGTIGDFQNALFIEAARVMRMQHPDDVVYVMVSYLPVPGKLGEMKTKPTQNAVRQFNAYGIQPDIIIARSEKPLDKKRKEKLAIWCNVRPEHIVSAPDIDSIYEVPLNFEKDNIGDIILHILRINGKKYKTDLKDWAAFVQKMHNVKKEVKIAIVGKYFDTGDYVLSDAYISVIEAIKFSSYALGAKPIISWINAKDFESKKASVSTLSKFDGVIVPGGFGQTGIEGKIKAVQFAREKKIPYFGLCYGLHMMVIDYARHVVGLSGAHTTEIDPKSPHPVIDIMLEQKKHLATNHYGGTMRLGIYPAKLKNGSVVQSAYGKQVVEERHRHRYEINPEYVPQLESAGLVFSGYSPDKKLMEIAELPKSEHPFFVGTQFHPELQARPLSPHPLFTGFIAAALKRKSSRK